MTDVAPTQPGRRELRTRWIRIGIGSALIAGVGAFMLIPAKSPDGLSPGDHAAAGLQKVLVALSTYANTQDGRLPPPDQIVSCLIRTGVATAETFRLESVPVSEAAFYYVIPQSTARHDHQPIVYTNPRVRQDRRMLVGFSDNHVEWLSPIQAQAFLSSAATRAVPLK